MNKSCPNRFEVVEQPVAANTSGRGRASRSNGLRRPRAARVRIANRVDIGGFTDIDPARAGAVLSLPIVINEVPITVTASACAGHHDRLVVRMNGRITTDLVHRVACSCVERHRVRGALTVDVECAIPQGSGAGASSQIAAGIVAAISHCTGGRASRAELAREAYRLETRLTSCGWQDQGPLVIGRCGFITAPPAPAPDAVVPSYSTLSVPEPVLHELERRGLLAWTGRSHFSKEILDDVKSRLGRGVPHALRGWHALYSLAHQAREAMSGDGPPEARISRLASIIAANWAAEIELTDGMVTTEPLAAVEPQLRELGGYKLLGAGRGGFLFFVGATRTATDAAAELLNGVAGWRVERWRVSRRPARIESL